VIIKRNGDNKLVPSGEGRMVGFGAALSAAGAAFEVAALGVGAASIR